MASEKKQNLPMGNFSSTAELTSNLGFQSSLSIASKEVNEKPYNPFDHRKLEHPNSTIGSILHLLKACLGSGILAMPAAFKNAGLVAGAIGTLLAGVICTHTVHILVKTSQEVCVDAKKPSMSFAETCGAAFTYGPKRVQTWGGAMRTITDISMTLAYLGVLCVYVVFIASSFKEVLDPIYPDNILSIQVYCLMTLIPLVLICQIRNLKYLVPFSAIANALILVVFAITLYYVFLDLPSPSEREMVASITQWPLFLSTVIFAMEGIGVVMPVENEMANPKRFLGCPGVLNVAMVIVISLYGVVGFFGYIQYGDHVKGSVTLNLPEDSLLAQSGKLLMALCIFLTYALQFYVPMEMVTRYLERRGAPTCNNLIQIGIRTGIVVFTVGIAAAFPNLELVISLVGAVFFSTLGLLIPAIVDTVYHWDKDLGPLNYILFKNILIGIISVVALVSGAYVSIEGMIEDFSGHHNEHDVHDNATLTLAQSGKLLMALCIFLTYALQFYVPMEMVTRYLERRGAPTCNNLIQIGIRTGIVVFTVGIAAAFPNLELVISLVGAVFFSTLGLLIPAIVDTVYHWDKDLGPLNYILFKNILIGVISVVALVSGAYVSIEGMIEDFSGHHNEHDVHDNATLT